MRKIVIASKTKSLPLKTIKSLVKGNLDTKLYPDFQYKFSLLYEYTKLFISDIVVEDNGNLVFHFRKRKGGVIGFALQPNDNNFSIVYIDGIKSISESVLMTALRSLGLSNSSSFAEDIFDNISVNSTYEKTFEPSRLKRIAPDLLNFVKEIRKAENKVKAEKGTLGVFETVILLKGEADRLDLTLEELLGKL